MPNLKTQPAFPSIQTGEGASKRWRFRHLLAIAGTPLSEPGIRRWQTLACLFVAVAALCAGQSQRRSVRPRVAELHGSVVTEQGTKIHGARVILYRTPDFKTGERIDTRFTATRNDGEFSAYGLQPGVYSVCPTVAGSDLVEPCHWSPILPTVALLAGHIRTGFRIVMPRGQRVIVRVEDPGKHLRAKGNARKDTGISIRAWSNGRGTGYADVLEDVNGESHILVVPRNRQIRLSARGLGDVEFDYEKANGQKVDLKNGSDEFEVVEFRETDGPKEFRLKTKPGKK